MGTILEESQKYSRTNIKIAFQTSNIIKEHLKPSEKTINTYEYNQSGAYQLIYNEYSLKNVGQTGCTFQVRYKDHIHAIINKELKIHPTHI
jgi:hypothetical protein